MKGRLVCGYCSTDSYVLYLLYVLLQINVRGQSTPQKIRRVKQRTLHSKMGRERHLLAILHRRTSEFYRTAIIMYTAVMQTTAVIVQVGGVQSMKQIQTEFTQV